MSTAQAESESPSKKPAQITNNRKSTMSSPLKKTEMTPPCKTQEANSPSQVSSNTVIIQQQSASEEGGCDQSNNNVHLLENTQNEESGYEVQNYSDIDPVTGEYLPRGNLLPIKGKNKHVHRLQKKINPNKVAVPLASAVIGNFPF
jgi:hypothetical protein